MASSSQLSSYKLYLRCLGTKATLAWNLEEPIQPILDTVQAQLVQLSTIHHALDMSLNISKPGYAVFLRSDRLKQFASQCSAVPTIYQPFFFTTAGNMQATTPTVSISHVNFYTSILGNLRAGGEVPTAACTPVASMLLIESTSSSKCRSQLKSNIDCLTQVSESLRTQTEQATARLEVSTTLQQLSASISLLKGLAFTDGLPSSTLFLPIEGRLLSTYVFQTLTWMLQELTLIASVLNESGAITRPMLGRLFALENSMFNSFLYGGSPSPGLKQSLADARQCGSLVLSPPFDPSQILDAASASSSEFHLVQLFVQLESDFDYTLELPGLCDRAASIVLLGLNAEVKRLVLHLERTTIEYDFKFLSTLMSTRKVTITLQTDQDLLVGTVYRALFVPHNVKHIHFHKLHEAACKRYVSAGNLVATLGFP